MSKHLKKIVEYNRTHYNSVSEPIMIAIREEADKHGIYSISSSSWGMIRFQESRYLPKFDLVVSGFNTYLDSEILRFANPATAKKICQDMQKYIPREHLRVEGSRIYYSMAVRLDTAYGNTAYDKLLRELYGTFEKHYRSFVGYIMPRLKGVSKSEIIWNRDRLRNRVS